MLSHREIEQIEHELAIVPRRSGACIEALRAVQRHRGWISDEAVRDIARFLEMSPDEVDSVATFYNLIYRKPVGRHVILICNSVSCWIMGYEGIRRAIGEKLGIGLGETTKDGCFTLLPNPCLGTCDAAPALMIDEDLHRDLTPGKIDGILERYR